MCKVLYILHQLAITVPYYTLGGEGNLDLPYKRIIKQCWIPKLLLPLGENRSKAGMKMLALVEQKNRDILLLSKPPAFFFQLKNLLFHCHLTSLKSHTAKG